MDTYPHDPDPVDVEADNQRLYATAHTMRKTMLEAGHAGIFVIVGKYNNLFGITLVEGGVVAHAVDSETGEEAMNIDFRPDGHESAEAYEAAVRQLFMQLHVLRDKTEEAGRHIEHLTAKSHAEYVEVTAKAAWRDQAAHGNRYPFEQN